MNLPASSGGPENEKLQRVRVVRITGHSVLGWRASPPRGRHGSETKRCCSALLVGRFLEAGTGVVGGFLAVSDFFFKSTQSNLAYWCELRQTTPASIRLTLAVFSLLVLRLISFVDRQLFMVFCLMTLPRMESSCTEQACFLKQNGPSQY